ncbi:MAG: hypothetical protein L6Q95_18910 [Planctomycetes bacterium]|nr:hypothetical protein [Planctomycetota bacterium]
MSWRLLLLSAVVSGCAHGHLLETTRLAPGQESYERYDYGEAKLSRSEDGGHTVELAAGRRRENGLPAPPILILGVRVRFPAPIEEGGEYAVAAPDEGSPGACVVELGHVYWFSCTWLPVGPGTVRVTRWNPATRTLAASFEAGDSGAAEGGAVVRHYAGSFVAGP